MAQTVTKSFFRDKDPFQKIEIPWTSDGSGNYDQTTDEKITGALHRVVFIPSAVDAPTDQYALTLKDENGIDIFGGRATALSATDASQIVPGITISDGTNSAAYPLTINDRLRLQGSTLGDAKSGTVVLYLR